MGGDYTPLSPETKFERVPPFSSAHLAHNGINGLAEVIMLKRYLSLADYAHTCARCARGINDFYSMVYWAEIAKASHERAGVAGVFSEDGSALSVNEILKEGYQRANLSPEQKAELPIKAQEILSHLETKFGAPAEKQKSQQPLEALVA